MKKPILVAVSVLAIAIIIALLSSSEIPGGDNIPADDKDGIGDTQNVSEIKEDMRYRKVSLYYYDFSKGECRGYSYIPSVEAEKEAVAKGLVSVEREVVDSDTVLKDTLELFLKGKVTDEEKAQGVYAGNYTGKYPLSGFSLKEFSLDSDGVLSLTFDDPKESTRGTFCAVEIQRQQLEATVRQFTQVKSIRILPEGEIFVINDF